MWWWLLALACSSAPEVPAAPSVDADVHPDLVEQSRLFERQVLHPADGVHVLVGYGLANVIVLEGPSGLVIVDTTEGREPATEALATIRELSDKPIAAIVLTHNHADHVFGSQVFADAAPPGTPIWAHTTTEAHIDRIVNVLRDAIEVRSARMFGTYLPDDRPIGDGIGLRLRFSTADIALARPTHTLEDRATLEAGGLTLELIHTPGETDDQLAVWWADAGVLLPADNIYQAFPNLYTLRGTAYRDPTAWVESLDTLRDLGADVLVPQHTHPVVGAEAVEALLTAYRDAIQYVRDQTVRGLNHGRTPDQLAAEIALPPLLAGHPWLAEHYGRVPWSVRAIADGTLGWFDGRATSMEPLAPDDRAQRYSAAFAAGQPLPDQARTALEAGDAAWAAELGQLWVDAAPDDPAARSLLADALDALARGHLNANAWNWYTTEALELRGALQLERSDPADVAIDLIDGLPVDTFMRALPPRLRADQVLDEDWRATFHFTDEDAWYTLHVRRGVAEVRRRSAETAQAVPADLRLTTTALLWKRVASGHVAAARALASGELEVEGGPLQLSKLQRWFER